LLMAGWCQTGASTGALLRHTLSSANAVFMQAAIRGATGAAETKRRGPFEP
jgi:hypothetical protein